MGSLALGNHTYCTV